MASKLLSIEISNELIKIAEVSHQGKKSVTVHKAATITTPENSVEDGNLKDVNALTEAIRAALKDNLISTKQVIMTVQSSTIASKEATIPQGKPSKMKEYVQNNASEYFPVGNLDDYSLTYAVLENINDKNEKSSRILAMAARYNLIDNYYKLAKNLGLTVVAIDYIGNSTLEMLKLQIDDTPSMVIQIGNDSTIINVLKNKVLQFQRTVPYGRSAVTNAVMENKKLSYQVAVELLSKGSLIHERLDGEEVTESLRYLINSISRIVDYYVSRNQSSPIEKAYIIGEGANVGGIDKLFANELNINFNKITELKNVEPDKVFRISKSELITYLSTMGACLDPVNFKQYTQAKTKASAKSIDTLKAVKVFVLLSVIFAIASFAIAIVKVKGLEKTRDEYKKEIKQLQPAKKLYEEWLLAKDNYSGIWNFYSVTSSNNSDYLAKTLDKLEEVVPSDMFFKEIKVVDGKVNIKGYCRDKSTLAGVIVQLKNVSFLKNVSSTGGKESLSNDNLKIVEFGLSFDIVNPTNLEQQILEDAGLEKKSTTKTETKTEETKKEDK